MTFLELLWPRSCLSVKSVSGEGAVNALLEVDAEKLILHDSVVEKGIKIEGGWG